jgi:hypothetical protein
MSTRDNRNIREPRQKQDPRTGGNTSRRDDSNGRDANNSRDYNNSREPKNANGINNISISRVNSKAEATGVPRAATSAETLATAEMLAAVRTSTTVDSNQLCQLGGLKCRLSLT